MNEKLENRYLRRQFRPIGWLLLAYFALMNLFVIGAAMVDMADLLFDTILLDLPLDGVDTQALASNGWGYILAVATGMLILFLWKDRSFWRQEVFSPKGKMNPTAFLALLCLAMSPQLINGLWITGLEAVMNLFDHSLLPFIEMASDSSDTFSMFLYASILAPITEELIFRGWILGALRPYGKKFAVLGSAIVFGLFHGNLIQTPYAFLVGLVFGYVTVEYSIWWSVALHMFNNLVAADLFSRLTSMLPKMVGAHLQIAVLSAFTIAGVVILVLKRKEIREYLRHEYMDRKCLKWFLLNSGFIALAIVMLINCAMTMLLF